MKAKMDADKEKQKSSKSSKGGGGGMGDKATMKEVEIKTCLEDLTAFIENFDVPEAHEEVAQSKFGVKRRHVKHKGDKDALLRETAIMHKYAKNNDLNHFAAQVCESKLQSLDEDVIFMCETITGG
jgi:hypothetical protein